MLQWKAGLSSAGTSSVAAGGELEKSKTPSSPERPSSTMKEAMSFARPSHEFLLQQSEALTQQESVAVFAWRAAQELPVCHPDDQSDDVQALLANGSVGHQRRFLDRYTVGCIIGELWLCAPLHTEKTRIFGALHILTQSAHDLSPVVDCLLTRLLDPSAGDRALHLALSSRIFPSTYAAVYDFLVHVHTQPTDADQLAFMLANSLFFENLGSASGASCYLSFAASY